MGFLHRYVQSSYMPFFSHSVEISSNKYNDKNISKNKFSFLGSDITGRRSTSESLNQSVPGKGFNQGFKQRS